MPTDDEPTLKLLQVSPEAISGALTKAEHYRYLNQPWQAESICRDVLAVSPTNQAALVLLVLSLTDQFDQGVGVKEAAQVVGILQSKYQQAYYSGIIQEREAIALFRRRPSRGSGKEVHKLFLDAMEWYRKAQEIRPANNDDAVLRWNACVRFLQRNWGFK